MINFFQSLNKRWHFLLLGGVVAYIGFLFGEMHNRDSIYQYQPFTIITLIASIAIGSVLYNVYLYKKKKISYFEGLLNTAFWEIIASIILIGVMMTVKYLTENYQMDFSTLLGFPYHPR
ncbi:hypothetical protein [Anaerosinus sp.]